MENWSTRTGYITKPWSTGVTAGTATMAQVSTVEVASPAASGMAPLLPLATPMTRLVGRENRHEPAASALHR